MVILILESYDMEHVLVYNEGQVCGVLLGTNETLKLHNGIPSGLKANWAMVRSMTMRDDGTPRFV